jgi:hypothetical protein
MTKKKRVGKQKHILWFPFEHQSLLKRISKPHNMQQKNHIPRPFFLNQVVLDMMHPICSVH